MAAVVVMQEHRQLQVEHQLFLEAAAAAAAAVMVVVKIILVVQVV